MPSILAAPLKLRHSPTTRACATEIKLMAGDPGAVLDDNLLVDISNSPTLNAY
jgi:hypothetical protein